jgi:uncharacterized delta-60 repeat protein
MQIRILFILFLFSFSAQANMASLDPSFGTQGEVQTDFGLKKDDVANAVALMPQGKIFVVGASQSASGDTDFALARYLKNGKLDRGFNKTGKMTLDILKQHGSDQAMSVFVTKRGNVVVAGESNGDIAVALLNRYGKLDTHFNGKGSLTLDLGGKEYAHKVIVDGSRRIVIATVKGNELILIRYRLDGEFDIGFGIEGMVRYPLSSSGGNKPFIIDLEVHEGLITVTAAYKNKQMAVRFVNGGQIDKSFGSKGRKTVSINTPKSDLKTIRDPKGNRLVVGNKTTKTDKDFLVQRYLP